MTDSVRQKVKSQVRKRDDYKCVVCGAPRIQVHHVVFLSRGGTDSPSNCVSLCEEHHTAIHERELEIVTFEADEEEIHDMDVVEGGISRAIWRMDENEKMEKAEKAHSLHNIVSEARDRINEQLIKMGFALCKFKRMNGWDALGYRSFREWCQDPDIDLRYDKAQRLVRITERLYLEKELPADEIQAMGIYKADRISQFNDHENFDELVEIAQGASRVDLDKEIKSLKNESEDSQDDSDGQPEWLNHLESYIKALKDDPQDAHACQKALNILEKRWKKIISVDKEKDR